jgi:predicted nucleotidyltransferase
LLRAFVSAQQTEAAGRVTYNPTRFYFEDNLTRTGYFCGTMVSKNKDIIVSVLKGALPGLKGIYLFGSRAKGSANSQSDYDLAILLDRPLNDALKKWNIAQELAIKLNVDVDLVDLKDASTVMQFQVISSGKRLYSSDIAYCDTFETFVYSSYLRLNEERREILDQVRASGKIFAS